MTNGLDDVIAAETVLSDVDGERGALIVRGHNIEELAGSLRFEEAVRLLWRDIVPTDAGDLTSEIAAGRFAAFERFLPLANQAAGLSQIEAMRWFISSIGDRDALAAPAQSLGAFGVAAAVAARVSAGAQALPPDPEAGHAADVLRMLRHRPADADETSAMDAYLVTVMDHGLNASTFAARVVASTQAGLVSSLVAGLSALKGPLHGGAPGPVLDMLDAVGEAGNAEAWMTDALDRGERSWDLATGSIGCEIRVPMSSGRPFTSCAGATTASP